MPSLHSTSPTLLALIMTCHLSPFLFFLASLDFTRCRVYLSAIFLREKCFLADSGLQLLAPCHFFTFWCVQILVGILSLDPTPFFELWGGNLLVRTWYLSAFVGQRLYYTGQHGL